MALMMKNEAAFLDGMARGLPIDVNDMSAGAPMLGIAIANGLERAAAVILDRKPDLSLADAGFGMTALHTAAAMGNAAMVRRLLAMGADPNSTFGPPGGPRHPCLGAALKGGNREVVKALLEAGAKADCDISPHAPQPEDRGVTPLTMAACQGDVELMRLLIDHGANVNHWPPSTATPLMQAALGGKFEAVKLLVEKGALIELHSNKLQANAFTAALAAGHREVADWLWERSKILQGSYPREQWAS